MTLSQFFFPLLFLSLSSGVVCAQMDSAENVYFVKNRDSAAKVYEPDYMPDDNAFYLYRNCIYNLILRDGRHLSARIVDIRDDLLWCDSIRLDPRQITAIKVPDRPGLGLYRYYSLKNALVIFDKGRPKAFPEIVDTLHLADSSIRVPGNYPILGMGELAYGDHIYNNLVEGYDFSFPKSRKLRTGIGFSPSMAVETRGVNLSFQTLPVKHRTVTIKGVNLDIGMYSEVFSIRELFYFTYDNGLNNLADSLANGGKAGRVCGLSLSGGGLVGDFAVRGVSVNGGVFEDYSVRGLVISGMQNSTVEFDGVAVSGLRNRSYKGRGMQVGLLNVCKDLKGVQIGLWNVNRKRSLPLINWSF